MSEEEKDSLLILGDTDLDINTIDGIDLRTYNYAVKVVLNLIEKQQKEIEELRQIKNGIEVLESNKVNPDIYYLIAKEDFLRGDYKHLLDDYISKNVIRDEIKEINKDIGILHSKPLRNEPFDTIKENKYSIELDVLEELLEESEE